MNMLYILYFHLREFHCTRHYTVRYPCVCSGSGVPHYSHLMIAHVSSTESEGVDIEEVPRNHDMLSSAM